MLAAVDKNKTMKPKKLIILIILIYSFFWILQRISFTGSGESISNSKKESKEDKFYSGEFQLDKDSIKLKNGDKIYVPAPWAEKRWYWGMGILPTMIKKKGKGIYLLIEIKEDDFNNSNFWFKNKEKGIWSYYSIHPLGGYVIELEKIPEEIELHVVEKVDIKNNKYENIDTLILRRKKEHRH